MDENLSLKVIARIYNDFSTKFGLPRQSGLVDSIEAIIVFEPEYRNPEALRGIEEYSHLWLLWGFSEVEQSEWTPTVRPPRLGGNTRIGVFATRSPHRPNPLGLSSVRLREVRHEENNGLVLLVSGVDMMNGTPIYDIKPYLPYVDSHPEASGSFAEQHKEYKLEVCFPQKWLEQIPENRREALLGALANDPRPAYQNDPQRIYGLLYADFDVRFSVCDGVLTVCEIVCVNDAEE